MRLLAGLAAGGLDIVTMCATSANVTFVKADGTTAWPGLKENELVRLLADPQGAGMIGRVYLAGSISSRPTLAGLRTCVMRGLHLDDAALRREDGALLRDRLRSRITQDFADGNVAIVDGWMLSLVEAQICAIAYLSGTGDA